MSRRQVTEADVGKPVKMTDLRRGEVRDGTLMAVNGDRAEVRIGSLLYRCNVGFVSVEADNE